MFLIAVNETMSLNPTAPIAPAGTYLVHLQNTKLGAE